MKVKLLIYFLLFFLPSIINADILIEPSSLKITLPKNGEYQTDFNIVNNFYKSIKINILYISHMVNF